MTLLLCDSFDHYTTLAQKWTVNSTCTVAAAQGRYGTAALLSQNTARYVRKQLDASYQTLTAGIAMTIASIGGTGAIITFLDTGSYQCELRFNAIGQLTITRDGTVLATSTKTIASNVYYYFELQVTIDDAPNGQAEAKVNGVTWASVVNGDTKNTANASANQFQIGGAGIAWVFQYYDDCYCLNDAGAHNNDFLGDIRVEAIMPEGAGATTDWDPSAGDNWECVDEIPPNDDTNYVSTATATEVDTYEFGDVTPTTGAVFAVVTYMYARKDDAGARVINSVVRPVGTDYASGASHSVGDTYTYYPDIYEENEEVTDVWTIATVNASEFGIKLES